MEKAQCVPISHLPLDIIRTNCPRFDANLFLWWQFCTGVSEEETRTKKQHEDGAEKLNFLPRIVC